MEFRELTLQRLKFFIDQKFFSVRDYLRGRRGVLSPAGTLATPSSQLP